MGDERSLCTEGLHTLRYIHGWEFGIWEFDIMIPNNR